jgi:hypothetical protein
VPERSPKKLFPNPFYVLLLLASSLFVLTTLGYLIGPSIQGQAGHGPGPGRGSIALAVWLDRRGPWALGVEVVMMIASGLLAMATDRWFPSRADRNRPTTD